MQRPQRRNQEVIPAAVPSLPVAVQVARSSKVSSRMAHPRGQLAASDKRTVDLTCTHEKGASRRARAIEDFERSRHCARPSPHRQALGNCSAGQTALR